MATIRSIDIAGDAAAAQRAARRRLLPHVEEGGFRLTADIPGECFEMGGSNGVVGSRYRFPFRPIAGGTRVVASLALTGLLGPLQALLRGPGNRAQLDQILRDVKAEVEQAPRTGEPDADPHDA